MTDELPPPDLTERLSKRILAIHGGTGDPWRDHWNLTESDSILHKDALAAISARATLERDAARLDDAREKINQWALAYPLDIFPKPDLNRCAEVLNAAGLTLDSISADAMRHVINEVKAMLDLAISQEAPKSL